MIHVADYRVPAIAVIKLDMNDTVAPRKGV